MTFNPMPRSEIIRTIEYCYLSEYSSILIVLTDGTALCAHISGPTWGAEGLIPASKECFPLKNHLKVEIHEMYNEHSIYVPLDQIAGISILPYDQEEIEVLGLPRVRRKRDSAYSMLCSDLMVKAKEHSFRIEKEFFVYSIGLERPFKWGDITFTEDTPLYCDWDFLSRTSGGLNSLGAGFIVSFSAGWKKNLWASFRDKVTHKRTTFTQVCAKKDAVVSGFVQFIKFNETVYGKNGHETLLEMESTKWYPGVISTTRVKHKKQLRKVSWALAYFNETSFMFPKNLWERFSQKIRIYGEVVPVAVRTEFGKSRCFLKVRAAAFMHT
jgi:hypothetical protein